VADENLDIIIQVRGGQAAATQIKGVAGATEQVGTSSEQTSKKTSKFGSQLATLAKGFAIYKGFQFIKSAVNQTVDLAKATAGLSRVTGMDTRTASGWVGIAKERGIAAKQLNMGFITLSRQMTSAASGSKTSAKAFSALGISQREVQRSSPSKVLAQVSDAFARMPDGAQKSALAQKLFGRSAQGLLPILNKGSASMNEQVGAMAKHINMSKADMERSLEMAKQQRELNATMLGFKVAVGSALLPLLTQIAKAIVPVIQGFATLMQGSKVFRIAVVALTGAIIALNIALSINPIVAIAIGVAALIAALILAYQKVTWFRDAVNSVFNFIKQHWMLLLGVLIGPLALVVAVIISNWGRIRNTAVAAFNAVRTAITVAIRAASAVINGLAGAARGTFNAVKSAAHAVGSAISSAFHSGVSAAEGALKGIQGVANGVWNAIKAGARAVGTVVSSVFNGVKSIIQSILNMVNSVISAAGKVSSVVGKIKGAGGSVLDTLSFGKLQGGGHVTGTGYHLVGEVGPEIVRLPAGATVTPAHRFATAAGSAPIHTHVYLDGREIAHAVGDYTASQQARR
jgi:TP901 family phage tail tape measure protein